MFKNSKLPVLLVGLLMSLLLFACSSDPGDPIDGDTGIDGDQTQHPCTNDSDCITYGDNWTCNTLAQICIDHGDCESDQDCSDWFGVAKQFCNSGKCGAIDETDGDEDGDQVVDGDPDDDEPVVCDDYSGFYNGEYSCGGIVNNYDTWVVVNPDNCSIEFVYVEGNDITGSINGSNISTNGGKTCTGSGKEGIDGGIDLSCNDGCNIKLTHKQGTTDTREGIIDVNPSNVDFGDVENETAKQTLSVQNMGEGELNIFSMFFANGSTVFGVDDPEGKWDGTTTMESGDLSDLTIKCSMGDPEEIYDTLVILSDAKNSPVLRIQVKTSPKAKPNVVADPTVIDFGSSPPDYDNIRYFLAKNSGGAIAKVTDIRITETATDAFSLKLSPEATPPFTIGAGYSQAVEINFRPIDGIHPAPSNQVGKLCVTWLDYNENARDTCVDLIGIVKELEPACIDVNPMEGVPGIWGMGELNGPGIKFGYMQTETHTKRDVEITNCGDLPLQLTGFSWNELYTGPPMSGRGFIDEPGSFVNRTLNRGQTAIVTIDYYPTTANEGVLQTAAFQFTTNAEWYTWLNGPPAPETNGLVVVGMSGTGARRGVEVLPSKLDFGLITVDCCSRAEELTLYNIGELPLEVVEIAIGAGSDNGFELIGAEFPITLGPDTTQSTRFKVKFCPDREGDFDGHVVIKSNDAETAEFIVPLMGEGTLLTHARDEFVQVTDPMVDILWVVDCSGSMGDEQDNLADNFDKFITQAVNWNAKLHVAVTSCDIVDESHSGNFQGSPKIIDTDVMTSQQAINAFIDTMDGLGTSCDGGKEAGLEAAHLALDEPLINEGNGGFLREDAKLSIIFVSDEPDNSIADWDFFVDFFRSIKGMRNRNMLEAYAIVGDADGGCTNGGEDSGASAGPRYIEVSDHCNIYDDEHFMSICNEDYGPIYENLAENLFALRSQFFLSRMADEATIVVTINGTVNNEWDYDDVSNSIIFPMENPPAPGATIVAEYDTLCLH